MIKKIELMKEILFYARKILCIPSGDGDNTALAMTALKNLSDYGFTLDEAGCAMLKTASKKDIEAWYYEASDRLNKLAGGNHTYKPFYPNFPEEVMEKTDAELFFDQILHYVTVAIHDVTDGQTPIFMPEGENRKEGVKSLEEHPLKVVATIDAKDEDTIASLAKEVFQNTLKSKLTPSADDMENIIHRYMAANPCWTKDADVAENRTVLSYLYAVALADNMDTSCMPALVANDYLRIAQIYSYMKVNDITEIDNFSALSGKNEFGKKKQLFICSIPNSMRRFIAYGLNDLKPENLEEDVARNLKQWKYLFKIMHAGQMEKLKNLHSVVMKVREGKPLNTFYARVEKAFAQYQENPNMVLSLYKSRPGEFVKALNRLLMAEAKDEEQAKKYASSLVEACRDTFGKVRPEDLVRLISYLTSRTREDRLPVHNVNGSLFLSEKKHAPLAQDVADLFIKLAKEGIASQIQTGVPYGKVYIDPQLAKAPLPTEVSDMSSAMNAYPRGTRIPIERNEDGSAKNMRVFIWWTNMKNERVDLDLSGNLFVKRDGHYVSDESISFHDSYCVHGATHSGDITNGGKFGGHGVCEYIDFNIHSLKEAKIDYVQVYVNSYTGQSLKDVPCQGGWMERDELDKSQQFDVRAVRQSSMLTYDGRGVVMAIIDVNAEEVIWMDAPDLHARTASTSLTVMNSFEIMLERYAKGDLMTMKDMAELAVSANGGEIVDSMEEADVIFSLDEIKAGEGKRVITSKNQDVWLGEFMAPQKKEEKETDAAMETGKTEEEEKEEAKEEKKHTIADVIANTLSN